MLGVFLELDDFSVSESDISNGFSEFSAITIVDPVPIVKRFFVIDSLELIWVIMTVIEFEVIGGESEVSFIVQLDHEGSISEMGGIFLERWFIDGQSEGQMFW